MLYCTILYHSKKYCSKARRVPKLPPDVGTERPEIGESLETGGKAQSIVFKTYVAYV